MENEKNWIDRIYDLMGNRTQKEFAEWLEQSPKKVNNYLNGIVEYPNGDFLLALAKKGVNINWFLTGLGAVYVKDQADFIIPPEAQILLRQMIEDGIEPEGLTEILKEMKDLQNLKIRADSAKHEMMSAYDQFKASFKRKKSEK